MSEYLLEILVEDMPPSHLHEGLTQLKNKLEKSLKEKKIKFSKVETDGTKRRLTAFIKNISLYQEKKKEQIIGPPKAVAFDENNNPTKAGEGFAKAKGKKVEELIVVDTPKGEYIAVTETEEAKKTEDILKQILPEILKELSFPKNMRWNNSGVLFSRPVKSIISLLDKNLIDFEFAGVKAGTKTKGHRILADNCEITIDSINKYKKLLKENKVIFSIKEREKIIKEEIKELEKELELTLVEDKELFQELRDIVEYPLIFTGIFESEYLEMPPEIIETFLKQEKKLFLTKKNDKIINRFVGIADATSEAGENIMDGFERVVKATLDDAMFFWAKDLEFDFDSLIDELKNYTFGEKIGTYYDKTQRIVELGKYFASKVGMESDQTIKKACKYSKVDQLTETVKESPSLQGTMGGLYLREKKEDKDIWKAIYEQYKPKNLSDNIPESQTGIILSLVDRIDTLTGAFLAGIETSGDKDPFGLRRIGNTIIKLFIEAGIEVNIKSFVKKSINLYSAIKKTDNKESILQSIIDFLITRFRYYLEKYKNIEYDVINAVLKTGFSDISYDFKRAEAVMKAKNNENFIQLIQSYKRVKNIVKDKPDLEFSEDKIIEKEEQELWTIFLAVKEEVDIWIKEKNFIKVKESLLTLRPFIDKYFDNVLVMDEDEEIKNNRIAMLQQISDIFTSFADLTEIVD